MAYFDEKISVQLQNKQEMEKTPPHLVLSVVRYHMSNKWSKILVIAQLDMLTLTSSLLEKDEVSNF